MKKVGQLLLGNKRRMNPSVWIKKKRTKESMAEMKVQWDSSVVPRIYMIEIEENLEDCYMNGNETTQDDVNKENMERE
jgi:hypothetical protein